MVRFSCPLRSPRTATKKLAKPGFGGQPQIGRNTVKLTQGVIFTARNSVPEFVVQPVGPVHMMLIGTKGPSGVAPELRTLNGIKIRRWKNFAHVICYLEEW